MRPRPPRPIRGAAGEPGVWRSRPGIALLLAACLLPAGVVLAVRPASPLLLAGVLAGVGVAAVGLRLQERRWRDLGLRPRFEARPVLRTAAIWTAALAALTIVARPVVAGLTGAPANLEAFRTVEGNAGALAAGLAVAWSAGAFGEELLLRGFVLDGLRELLGDRLGDDQAAWGTALLLTGILTGAGHAYQGPTGAVVTGILALGFGAAYLTSGRNLWVSILAHGMYDTVAFVLLYLGIRPSRWVA